MSHLSQDYCTLSIDMIYLSLHQRRKLQVIMRVPYGIEQLLYLSCPAKLYIVY